MDMDSIVHYLEDDENPWEDIFGEHGSESGAGTDRDEADYESSWKEAPNVFIDSSSNNLLSCILQV